MEEKDKTVQKIGDQPSFRENSPGYEKLMRPPELDAALQHHEKPKNLIAGRLTAKPHAADRAQAEPAVDEDANAQGAGVGGGGGGSRPEDSVASREDVKKEAMKSLRIEQRRLQRAAGKEVNRA